MSDLHRPHAPRSEAHEGKLYRLVYMSRAVSGLSGADLQDILDVSRARNHTAGVTGLLLYAEGSFIQALEGGEDAVESIYRSIENDDRHAWLTVVLREPVARRAFPHWSMGFRRHAEMPAEAADVFAISPQVLSARLNAAPPALTDVMLGFTDHILRLR